MAKKPLADEIERLIQKKLELLGQLHKDMDKLERKYFIQINEIDRRIYRCQERIKEGYDHQ